ncbi:MAG: hypothetical protein U5L96_19645 [Owenweeksia sp.]|nr:hypothetical protein [Owenweeksia sp.]
MYNSSSSLVKLPSWYEKVRFAIPNLLLFNGDKVKKQTSNGIAIENGRLTFTTHHYQIIIDLKRRSRDRQQNLKLTGGYLTMYNGEVTKTDGQRLSTLEVEDLLIAFNTFISFR